MNLRNALVALASLLLGCGGFRSTIDHGIPNLVEVAPRLYRMGQPADVMAWNHLASRIGEPGGRVLVVKLNSEAEGSDASVVDFIGWRLVVATIPPEENEPLSVLTKPDPVLVRKIVREIAEAYEHGDTVIWHCTEGRDRTGLITGLVGMRLLGWSKSQAWDDMISHGFRWELPALDAYWMEDAR